MSGIYYNSTAKQQLNLWLEAKQPNQLYILVDSNTHNHCLSDFLDLLDKNYQTEIIEIEPGEDSKNIEILAGVWQSLLELGADRDSILINLGGGVVTDLGGFVASTFKRGISFINVPTSLLAMVDASVGGKTGINLNQSKNQVGTICFPEMVLIFPAFLNTLDAAHVHSGFAEMLKHGLIAMPTHWEALTKIKPENIEAIADLIPDSVAIKSKVVDADPTEKGLRKTLNFGHTVGHAIESEFLHSNTPLLHGYAVASGMLIESIIGLKMDLLNQKDFKQIADYLIASYQHLPIKKNQYQNLLDWMQQDKKNQKGELSFALLEKIGTAKINVSVSKDLIESALDDYNQMIIG